MYRFVSIKYKVCMSLECIIIFPKAILDRVTCSVSFTSENAAHFILYDEPYDGR